MRGWGTRSHSSVLRGMVAAVPFFLSACSYAPDPIPVPAPGLLETGLAAPSPAGFVSFCMRFPDQCGTRPTAPRVVGLNEETWRLLNNVNRSVNDDIWPEDDLRHYGRAEYWTIPTDGYGDCDDYALTKRKQLLEAGLPESALRIAVVYSVQSGRHAVLTVTTDHGDLVLDNLTYAIKAWNETPFVWIERQASTDPMQWTWLKPVLPALQQELPTAQIAQH